jgi:hypothetical protein
MNQFDSKQYAEDVRVNRNDLEEELAVNPAKFAYYIEQYALWSAESNRLKILRDNRGAEIYVDLKNSGKATDGFITATQKLDNDYRDYEERLRLAREQEALYEGAKEALKNKQFSLGTLSANNRAEFDASTSAIPSRSTAEERIDRRNQFRGGNA